MGTQLERQLGELSGVLKGLTPALERLEDRQNETEQEVSAAKERIEGMRRDFEELKNRTAERVKDLYTKCGESLSDNRDNSTKLGLIEQEVKALQKKEEGLGQKAWDIIKILLAAAVTAFVTWRLTRGG